jgi:hypothetical protein
MSFLSPFVVHKPLNLLIVGALFACIYFVLRFSSLGEGRRPGFVLIPAVLWGLYAAWEWLVMTRSPEANIRVDLMVILPVILAVSIGCPVKALQRTALSP